MAAIPASLPPMHNFPQSVLRATGNVLQHTNPETNAWLRAQLLRQIDPNDLVAAMVQAGRPQEVAALLVSLAMQGVFVGESPDPRILQRSPPETVQADHADDHFVDGGDLSPRKVMSLGSLDVILYEDFITPEEADHIIQAATPRLQRSMVVGPEMSNIEVPIRTSDGMFMEVGEDEVVRAVERRIAAVTRIPVNHGEGLQVLRYRGAQEYRPHFDFFEPDSVESARKIEVAGNRVGTLIVYLNEVERGGATYFPQLKLAIHPKRYSALWFGYLGADGVPDMRSEHAGMPVLEGEKWIMTKWLRQKPIPGVVDHAPDAVPASSVVPFIRPAAG